MRGLSKADLIDSPKRDRWCATLADALGYSINAVFAKLADRHIDEARMTQYVSAFGFGQRLPFGPSLAFGGVCWIFWGWQTWDWYFSLIPTAQGM